MLVGVLPSSRVNIDGYVGYFRAELDTRLRCLRCLQTSQHPVLQETWKHRGG